MERGFRELLVEGQVEMLAELREEHSRLRADIPEKALLWLALVPVWTAELATGVRLASTDGAIALLERVYSEALCERSPPRLGDDRVHYWMRPSVRAETLLEARTTRGLGWLQKGVQEVAGKILTAQKQGIPTPRASGRWAALAVHGSSPTEVAKELDARVEKLLERGDSGEALRWIEAAVPLEEILDGELTVSVARAGRRLELHHRRRYDLRHLGHYLQREQQVRAFDELIAGPDDRWALHYVGAGGVGKTMVMRHVSAKLVPGKSGTCSRVDFDYLNPDYPGRAPALLLSALAEELALHDQTGSARRLFARFEQKRSTMDERLRNAPVVARPAAATIDVPEFDEVLQSFADAVEQLPRPVVILLDTCEELSKIRADGTVPANVQATFGILERLHERLPGLRVVFGGRRPLASSGADWHSPGSSHPARPYLRLHEIRGFTREEAERFLRETVPVRGELVEPILRRSFDAGDPERFQWRSASEVPAAVDRYSPFDLALYATWAAGDDEVTPEAVLEAATDRYVDMRLIARIRHPALRRLLPAVALLGRFDRDTLRATSPLDDATFEEVIEELAEQEWIERQRGEFLEVDRGLRPRLFQYCLTNEPAAVETARTAAADRLERVTLENELGTLDVSHFEACLRMLRLDPARACRWWRAVEQRFAREQAYEWARALLYQIIDQQALAPRGSGAGAGAEAPADELLGSLLATYVATQVHASPTADLDARWAEVEQAASIHPVPEERERLRVRAVAGRVAGACYAGRTPTADEVEALIALEPLVRTGIDNQASASIVAAVEALVERIEAGAAYEGDVIPRLRELALALGDSPGRGELGAFAVALAARLVPGSSPSLADLVPLIDQLSVAGQRWLDWRAPEDTAARLRLEFVRAAYGRMPPAEILAQLGEGGTRVTEAHPTVDAERLASALVLVRRSLRPLTVDGLTELAPLATGTAEPACNAHRAFPPLFATLAGELGRQGMVGEALTLLEDRARLAEQTSSSLGAVQAADLERGRLVRLMRLRDSGVSPALEGGGLEEAETRWVLDGLDGPKKPELLDPQWITGSLAGYDEPHWLHARWRSLYGLRPEWALAAIAWIRDLPLPDRTEARTSFACASRLLDALEANVLAAQLGRPEPFEELREWSPDFEIEEPALALRLACRAAALADRQPQAPEAVGSLGIRRAAEIMLDEAEVLSLRLPRLAQPLFRQAHEWFGGATDPSGSLLASVSEALAMVRTGDRVELSQVLEPRIAQALNRSELGLPQARQVSQLAFVPTTGGLEDLTPAEWRPWLARLIACWAWRWQSADTKDSGHVIQEWLEATYGRSTEAGVVLPAELDGLLSQPSRLRGSRLRRLRRPGRLSPRVLLVSAALAALAGGVALAATYPVDSTGNATGGFVILFALILLGGLSFGSLRAMWASRRALKIAIASASSFRSTTAIEPVMTASLEPGGSVSVPLGAEYEKAADDLPEPLALALRQRAARVRRRTATVELAVDRKVAAVCWEGLCAHAARSLEKPRDVPFRFRRVGEHAVATGAPEWRRLSSIVSFVADLRQETMSRQAWAPLARRRRFTVHSFAAAALHGARLRPDVPVHVLHLVAQAIETASGVRLELQPPDVASKEVSDTARGDLVRPEELLSLFPEAGFYILQGRPLESVARTGAEREQAALLRAFAAELSALGAPVVVTVPPFGAETGAAVVGRLGETLRKRRPNTALPSAVRKLGLTVLKTASGPELEAALDFTVYTCERQPHARSASRGGEMT